MNIISLPKNYLIARYIYLTEKLSELPAVSVGRHKGSPVFRVRTGDRSRIFKEGSANGIKVRNLYELRGRVTAIIEEIRKSFSEDIGKISSGFCIRPYEDTKLGREFYRSAVPDATTFEKKSRYVLNGINYRSRVEFMIAQVLTDMGLEFKYECDIPCGGTTHNADFLVYLPEFGRCFMIEYLGRLDDEGYVYRNSVKIRDYLSSGYYIGTDLLILCGNEVEMPSMDTIRSSIRHMIELLTSQHLTPVGAVTF